MKFVNTFHSGTIVISGDWEVFTFLSTVVNV